ncbi:MAG: tripartite tricarboxylate transporter substrate binding protein [Bacillaceae bacterium]|nr:tripartite tricarboxylate transporter substrate binding protein [Bacillaceae bacterium]
MKTNVFKLFILAISLLLVAACSSGNTSSQDVSEFPTRDLEIIVPYAAGGTTDTAARALASVVGEYLPKKANVNVVNKAGGGGVIGSMDIYNAKADGYKIGMNTIGPMTIKPHTDNTAYSYDTFEPIMQVVATPNVLLVQIDAPWNTYEEWFEYVKANPGKFTYSTTGAGLTQHITMESFSNETGVELTHVPYDGGAPAIAALLGGHVQGSVVQTLEALPHVQSGSVKALINTGSEIADGFEDVPLLKEKGVNVASDVWTGLVAPQDTPKEIVAILHEAFKKALEDERVIETFAKLGVPTKYASPEEFAEIIKRDYEINGEVLKATGHID